MQRYDVVLVGFGRSPRGPQGHAEALAEVFGIDVSTAQDFIDRAPVVVKRGGLIAEAQQYAQALRSIGAEVEFKRSQPESTGDRPAAAGHRQPAAAAQPGPPPSSPDANPWGGPRDGSSPDAASTPNPWAQPTPEPVRAKARATVFGAMPSLESEPRRRSAPSDSSAHGGASAQGGRPTHREETEREAAARNPERVRRYNPSATRPAVVGVAPSATGASPAAKSETSHVRPGHLPSTAAPSQRRFEADDTLPDNFWKALPGAITYPLQREGLKWAGVGLLLSAVCVFFITFSFGILGLIAAMVCTMAIIGYAALYAQACMVGAIEQLGGPSNLPHMDDLKGELVLPGSIMVLWGLVASSPALIFHWSGLGQAVPAVTGALLMLPFYLWPMALAESARSGSIASMFDILDLVKRAVKRPGEYTVLALIPYLFGGLAAALLGLVASAGVGAMIVAGLFAFLPMIYGHGIMGTLIGVLGRTYPEVFADE